jgi:hypothetical protein
VNSKINKKNFIIFLITLTILKIVLAFFYGDTVYEYEWGIIVKNLLSDFSFSYHEIDGKKIPSAYMPPLYAYFLYSISLLGFSEFVTVKLVLLFQCILSSISVFYFFKILKIYFEKKYSIIFSIIYFLIPINFYSATQVSSVACQMVIFILFLYYYLSASSNLDYFKVGIFSGFALLIRGEFWLLFLILIFYKVIIKNINIKQILITIFLTVLIISPTLVRNYISLEELVLTKSSGYNLWRGNSISTNINGEIIETMEIKEKKIKLKNDLNNSKNINKYEIYLDELYFQIAKKNILSDPLKYLIHYINKFFAFLIFNPSSDYPNYYNLLVVIPEILISLFAIMGIIQNILSKKINYEILIVTFFYLMLIPAFFILPRYKLFIYPMYIIFSCYFFTFLFNNIFSRKQ